MNRCGLAIRMLHILRAKNTFVKLDVIAELLETNVRNVREYKKVLEVAGYVVETKRGKHGGYALKEAHLVPSVQLTEKEISAVSMAVQLLEHRPEFLYYPELVSASGKFLSNSFEKEQLPYVYQQGMVAKMNQRLHEMVEMMQLAVRQRNVVSFVYTSLSGERKEKLVTVHPYDIVNNNGSFYVIAYALQHKQFRNYKISLERMKDVKRSTVLFQRDVSYQIKDYIGKQSIIKGAQQRILLEIRGAVAVYIAESEIGMDSSSHWEEDVLYLTTTFENEKACDSFILSLGSHVKVIGPEEIKVRIKTTIAQMYEQSR